jgi:bacteriocin-like protein
MTYLKATDSNGADVYLFQLEGNQFISIPKDQLEFKPLSTKELKEIEGTDDETN